MKKLRSIKKRNLYVAFVAALAVTFSLNTYASEGAVRDSAQEQTPVESITPSPEI